MTEDRDHVISQAYAREVRQRELGRRGCDDCGSRFYSVHGMIGTAAVRVRLCSECAFYRWLYGDAPRVEVNGRDWY